MPVPSAITDLSQTANDNYPAGSESPNTADNYFRAYAAFIATLRDGKGFTDPVTLASDATTDIGAQNALFVEITGSTGPVTSFGTNYNGPRFLRFTGTPTLTHNSTTLNLPGSANITVEAGDTCIAIPNSTPNGWNIVHYMRKDLAPGVADSAATATSATTATTSTTATNLAGGGAGQVPYQSASGTTAMLAAGSSGQVLTSSGASAPTWQTPVGSGLVNLNSGTVSSAATLDIVMTSYTSYANKKLVVSLVPATDGAIPIIRTSTNGGSSFASGLTDYTWEATIGGVTTTTDDSGIQLSSGGQVGNGSAEGISLEIVMFNTTSTAKWPAMKWEGVMVDSAATPVVRAPHGSGGRRTAEDTDAVRLLFSTGNIASGTWTLYGYN